MSNNYPIIQVSKIDLEHLVTIGVDEGYDRYDVEFALKDCEIAREGEPITVVYREYIGKVGPFASDESREIVRLVLNRLFDSRPAMDNLFILDY